MLGNVICFEEQRAVDQNFSCVAQNFVPGHGADIDSGKPDSHACVRVLQLAAVPGWCAVYLRYVSPKMESSMWLQM